MYALMKEGKYFTGDVTSTSHIELLAWTRHPAEAKVWEKSRFWAQRAADKWGGEVIELNSPDDKSSTEESQF